MTLASIFGPVLLTVLSFAALIFYASVVFNPDTLYYFCRITGQTLLVADIGLWLRASIHSVARCRLTLILTPTSISNVVLVPILSASPFRSDDPTLEHPAPKRLTLTLTRTFLFVLVTELPLVFKRIAYLYVHRGLPS
jgi:hypothetical protein